MTDEKKKTEEKAEDKKIEHKDESGEQAKQISEENVVEKISEEPKETDSNEQTEKVDDVPDVKEEKEPVLEKPTEEKEVIEEPKKEPIKEEPPEKTDSKVEVTEKKPEPKKKPAEAKPDKKTKKKDDIDEDFQYIVRIANTDIDGDKNIVMGIAQIKGIGRHLATLIADATGIDKKIKMGKLSEVQIGKIRDVLENISSIAPGWMLNHRKDIDTGKDIHLISSDVDLRLRDDVNLLKMIRSYRGIRHEAGLAVRGQRTRANNRRGLALGVSKKRP